MVVFGAGNLLESDVRALVNPVNTVGVMGKGLALEFLRRYPENALAYTTACARGVVKVGRMFVTVAEERYIINFPTKRHWKDPSRLEYVVAGMVALELELRNRAIKSIAIPALGCGLGGLAWSDVWPVIGRVADELPNVRFVVFPPEGAW